LAAAILGGVLGVLSLVLLVIGLLGLLQDIMNLILWVVALLLFIGVLIAAAFAIDSTKYADFEVDDASYLSYNENSAVKDYVDGYLKWREKKGNEVEPGDFGLACPPLASSPQFTVGDLMPGTTNVEGGPVETRRRARGVRTHRSKTKKTKDPIYAWCSNMIQSTFPIEIKNSDLGGCSGDFTFAVKDPKKLPLPGSVVLTYTPGEWTVTGWYTDASLEYGMGSTFVTIPICYGVKLDADPFNTPPCEREISRVEKCAPGWTKKRLADLLYCQPYHSCVDEYLWVKKEMNSQWTAGTTDGMRSFRLSVGWDKIEIMNKAVLKHTKEDAEEEFYTGAAPFHVAQTVLLGDLVVGGVLAIVGLIFELIADNKPQPVCAD
jgi:hypothetical protein